MANPRENFPPRKAASHGMSWIGDWSNKGEASLAQEISWMPRLQHPFPCILNTCQLHRDYTSSTTSMTRLRCPQGLPNAIACLLLAFFALPTHALYFYMQGGTPK